MARRTTAPGNTDPTKPRAPRVTRSAASAEVMPAAPRVAPLDGAAASRREPTSEEIRQRAYEIYLSRGSRGGSPEADWLQAERELRARR